MKKKHNLGNEAVYDARTLGLPRMLVLGLQHLFAMFGATVLVPILVQSYGLPLSIQTTLLFAGLGTLLFHVCTKLKVPAFLGSSFAFLGGFEAVAKLDVGKFATMTGEEKLPYALGGIVIAGGLYPVSYTHLDVYKRQAVCVACGGMADDEIITEARCIRDELVRRGIDPGRIYLEEKSLNTRQNISYAADIIRAKGLPTEVAVASDNFHQLRAARCV